MRRLACWTPILDRALAAGEVSRRLEEFGRNRLPEGSKKKLLKLFRGQFHNLLIHVAWPAKAEMLATVVDAISLNASRVRKALGVR